MIEPEALDDLLRALAGHGFRTVGPTVRDGAIVYDDIESAADLPIGWTDDQEAGRYRLERREDEARFGYAVGPHSWKQFLLPARIRLWRARKRDDGFVVEQDEPDGATLALVGVRACELHGIAIQDKVLLGGTYADADYAARRKDAFIVAVNCFEPAATCFCTSMGTGPKAEAGYDLALTEILDGGHRLLVEVGTIRGADVMADVPTRPAEPGDLAAAGAAVDGAAQKMGRHVDTTDIRDMLARNLENDRWDEVASRCLTCGNCTLVCPTCFCTSVEDHTEPGRRRGRAHTRVGLVLLGRLLVHPRRQHPPVRALAVPPVADPQVRHVVRPVRQLGLRRLRPLHRLVPGRDRRDRGAGSHPNERGDSRWTRLRPSCATSRCSRG